jgi:isocitrate dehydrogenase
VHTADIYESGRSTQKVGTQGFADALIRRLGESPKHLSPVKYEPAGQSIESAIQPQATVRPHKQLVGVDVFLDWDEDGRNPNAIGAKLEEAAAGSGLKLKMITNRGVKVYPEGFPETFCTDHWRCRFVAESAQGRDTPEVAYEAVLDLLRRIGQAGLDFIKTEHLYLFDGQRGYSLGQGE